MTALNEILIWSTSAVLRTEKSIFASECVCAYEVIRARIKR